MIPLKPQLSEPEFTEALKMFSHDLRNSLAVVFTNLSFMGDSQEESLQSRDVQESLVDSRLACFAIDRLVSNLESLTRLREPKPYLIQCSWFDVRALIDEVVCRHRESAVLRNLDLQIHIDEKFYKIWANADCVRKSLDNLLANAIQFAPQSTSIVLQAISTDEKFQFKVFDHGPIIPIEWRTKVLTIEGQVRSKEHFELRYGRGFSLYASLLAAFETGGTIKIEEEEGLSVLMLILPMHTEEP